MDRDNQTDHHRAIYLDHAATTPLDAEVLAAMMPYFSQQAGNPSSIHRPGRAARQALDEARDLVGSVLGASHEEIIFTSGGSESNNLALKGVALAQQQQGRGHHLVVSSIEHHAVLQTVEALARQHGFAVTLLEVDERGIVSPDAVQAALRPDTALVSVMYANNEIGTVQPIVEIGTICREAGVPLHTDAVQAAGTLPLYVNHLGVDLLSLSAHKFYGPKGVGVLYVRRGTPLLPQMSGGDQERRRRAGTENVPGIVGLATALRCAEERRPWYVHHCGELRNRIIDGALGRIAAAHLNGERERRLPTNANLAFEGVEGESVVLCLDQQGIFVSSSSACSSGAVDPSHVLLALGVPHARAVGAVRFTVGRETTHDDIDTLLDMLPTVIEHLRAVGSTSL